jgi:uncharacterized protein involved in type VI secretion and phage assembly
LLGEKKKRQQLVYMEAQTNCPELRPGDVAKMNAWIPENKTYDTPRTPIESYFLIEVIHKFADGEGYSNSFIGVPRDLFVPPNYDVNDFPKAQIQHATVTDNKDPEKMGRVRVQFPWQKAGNQQTPWIQVIQPHAGAGKGTYINPEINETVLCAFQGGNAECPIVLGTAYNGGEIAAYYTDGNDIKVIQTRSGIKRVANDAEGSILEEDAAGSFAKLERDGNITLNAVKDMNIIVGENLNITVGNNVKINVGGDYGLTVENDCNARIGKQYSLTAGEIFETAEKDITSESSHIKRTASQSIEAGSDEGNVIQNAQIKIKNNSRDKNNSF